MIDLNLAKYWLNHLKKKKKPIKIFTSDSVKIIDLFSGCGGLSLGAEIACHEENRELEIIFSADIWPEATNVYKDNFRKYQNQVHTFDLTKLTVAPGSIELSPTGQDIAKESYGADIIVAGPPCQGNSDLNNKSRRDDPRNLLYTIPVAFALNTNAKLLIVENVPTVIHSSNGVVNTALGAMEQHGYAVVEYVADARNFGIPQARKRHFLIASKIHSKAALLHQLSALGNEDKNISLLPFIADLEDEAEDPSNILTRRTRLSAANVSRINYLFSENVFDLPNSLRPPCHRDKAHSYVSMYGRMHSASSAQTITGGFGSMGQGRFVHPTRRRMITPHEAARIQGFPDYFSFKEAGGCTALRQIIGNAVPPPIAAALISKLFLSQPSE